MSRRRGRIAQGKPKTSERHVTKDGTILRRGRVEKGTAPGLGRREVMLVNADGSMRPTVLTNVEPLTNHQRVLQRRYGGRWQEVDRMQRLGRQGIALATTAAVSGVRVEGLEVAFEEAGNA